MSTGRLSYDVVTIGAATRDVFLQNPDVQVVRDRRVASGEAVLVPLGSKIDVRSTVLATGGGATNAAATFAAFGFRTTFFGKIGADPDGDAVLHDLRRHHIDSRFVRRDPVQPTALSVLLSVPRHGRTVLISRGASADLTRHDLPIGRVSAEWLYITSLGGDLGLLRWILAAAARRRIPVLVNPGAGELRHAASALRVLRAAAIVMLNREEAVQLTGAHRAAVPELLLALQRRLSGMIVCTDEANGAWVRVGGDQYHARTHHNAPVLERTGAGDAFGSGFLVGLLRSGGAVDMALQTATANAESVMKKVGAKNGILTRLPNAKQRVRVTRD